ncbi:hypothetical protein NON08_10635 [Cetobacterium somerae]|uniref:hypothetical protein n=1 Tax=Cetobacterium sp. NK01 TaxID=2993530 RepID=UPI0021172739|nr:hypothetical protein [Cetobacterium sp. NK01]MCQ8212977.1 hypothetical protein [Cetobacterium sp. NK01]
MLYLVFVLLHYLTITKNYTLKDSIDILKENSEKVYNYRFEDIKNISNEINKNNIQNLSLDKLDIMKEGELLIVRKNMRKLFQKKS